jgi:hypothetical protein
MTIKEIEAVIKQNPKLKFEEMKKQANEAGIDDSSFSKAWFNIHPILSEKGSSRIWGKLYFCALLLLTAACYDATTFHFFLTADPNSVSIFEKVGVVGACVLMAHVTTLVLTGRYGPVKSTFLGFLFAIMVYIAKSIPSGSGVYATLIGMGDLVYACCVLYIIVLMYNLGFLHSLILLIVNVLVAAGVFLSVIVK